MGNCCLGPGPHRSRASKQYMRRVPVKRDEYGHVIAWKKVAVDIPDPRVEEKRNYAQIENHAYAERLSAYANSNQNQNRNFEENNIQASQNLQHISEREPDDIETDPSLNPTKETLFMQRSCRDVELSMRRRRSLYDKSISRRRQYNGSMLHRSSSTSTIHLDDSTVSRPHPKSTVRALSRAVFLQIKNRDRRMSNGDSPDIFDERLHPVQNDSFPDDYAHKDPDERNIYRFIRCLFQSAKLSPECAIVTMVYLERLLASAELELTPCNWKRIVLCAILLASKVWDDQAVWNVDYCQILRDLNVDDVNELERQFLEIIQFNINVPSSVYAKYYFDIRTLSDINCQPIPLSVERAFKLEALSRVMEDSFHETVLRTHVRRCTSLDGFDTALRSPAAILS